MIALVFVTSSAPPAPLCSKVIFLISSIPGATEVVEYRDIQFTKAPEVLRTMNFSHLEKSDEARKQLADKGIR